MTELIKQDETNLTQIYKVMESVIITGDLSKLNPKQRVEYYNKVCESLGLNPLTRPFDYHIFNGKMSLYARKECGEQLRFKYKVSITKIESIIMDGIYIVTAYAETICGKKDVATGAVPILNLKGETLSNAIMKAECVPVDYQILTKKGFKSHLDIEIGDIVASYNIGKRIIEWTPLLDKNIYFQQIIKNYYSSVTEFDFTEGHKWIFLSANEGKAELIPFEEAKENQRILLTAQEIDNNNKIQISPEEAAILGWIITDGTIKKYKGEYYRASICQSKPEMIEVINNLLKSLGNVSQGLTDNRGRGWMDQTWWYLSNKQTQTLFNKFNFKSLDDLPRIATHMNFECRQAMLEAMMQADGDKRHHFGKGKLPIVECFQILCTLNGIALSKTKVRLFSNSTQPFYQVKMLSYTSIVKKYLQSGEEYISDVWCPTTENGTWIMRSPEGQIAITGNTKAKRRVTLSICGLGFTDESELDSIPNAKAVKVDHITGQIVEEIPAHAKRALSTPLSPKEIIEEKTVMADVAVPQSQFMDAVATAKNITELKRVFAIAYRAYSNDEELLKKVIEVKDIRLKEIEDYNSHL